MKMNVLGGVAIWINHGRCPDRVGDTSKRLEIHALYAGANCLLRQYTTRRACLHDSAEEVGYRPSGDSLYQQQQPLHFRP